MSSNIIKSVYFNVDKDEKKVIDSDSVVEDYIPGIYDRPDSAYPDFRPISLGEEYDSEGREEYEDEEFSSGIPSVIHMDKLKEEEREKLSADMRFEMEAEAQRILDDANERAEQIVAMAMDEAEEIRNKALIEGREEGLNEGREEAKAELVEYKDKMEAKFLEEAKEIERQRTEMEPFFAELTADLVEKITGILCEDNKDIILNLIERSVEGLERPKKINIRVSKADMANVTINKSEIKELAESAEEFDIVEDSNLEENQCIIETEDKIIDCSLDVQLKSLREKIMLLTM